MIRCLPLLSLVAAVPAGAQESGEVVVVGRGLAARPGDAAASAVTIDRARLDESASGRLENVLADVAGLQQFRRSDSRTANPTSQGISLRGIGGNASSRALLVLDGVPQADPFGGWVPFPAYAVDRIGLIRVTRGGGSGYLGPGALAGSVEIESAGAADQPPLSADIAYGSRHSLDASASALLSRGGGFVTVAASYAGGDGFVPVVESQRGPADRPAPYEQASIAIRTVVPVGATTEMQASASAFTDTRERGTAFTRNRSQGADASLRLVGRGAWGWSALAYLQTRAFASQFAAVDAARAAASLTLDQYNTPATGLGGRIELAPPVGAGRDVRIGADVRRVDGQTQENFTYVAGTPTRRRIAGGEALTWGVFADASTTGPVTLTLGGRVDRWRLSDGRLLETTIANGAPVTTARFAARSGTEWTGRVGAAWQVAPPLKLRASAYRGWRLPTLNELYRPFRVGADATAANAALAPERLTGVDGGMSLTPGAGLTLGATLFWNRLAGAIANVTAGRGPGNFAGVGFVGAAGTYRIRQNLDAIRSTGLEVDARWDRGPFYVLTSWSHVDPRVEAHGLAGPLDGLRPAQTPLDSVSGTIGWHRGIIGASTTLRHVARQFEDDQNSRALAPATTLDAYLALPITRGLAIELRGENLFDERVEAGISGADIVERATPRTLWIGLKLRG
ncbi:outer membrane receptor protein involved in Fe transport [Sphingomonas jinjuensis]|uniref:Outer membrane receptor protein involved in Fe transport n=1 Tax=Sphingomonas jinjuensis TaxID=535907 RepID=A0A840FEZ8_9SPHN|nr:TonB-dependent receptor [Sphingomonas jinjuensis]MBB4154207.1 outer membrane receptor protein involved in Fe transport [Sphingomonas jinjuensis]